jgi:hypothetical protein
MFKNLAILVLFLDCTSSGNVQPKFGDFIEEFGDRNSSTTATCLQQLKLVDEAIRNEKSTWAADSNNCFIVD